MKLVSVNCTEKRNDLSHSMMETSNSTLILSANSQTPLIPLPRRDGNS